MFVFPAKAGIQGSKGVAGGPLFEPGQAWTPTWAGVTVANGFASEILG